MKRTALPLRRTPIRRVSLKRAKQNREYAKKRKAFLEAHPFCQLTIQREGFNEQIVIEDNGDMSVPNIDFNFRCPRATEIHHVRGRIGTMLNDETHWLAVSREGHEWIHQHPSEARKRGWLV